MGRVIHEFYDTIAAARRRGWSSRGHLDPAHRAKTTRWSRSAFRGIVEKGEAAHNTHPAPAEATLAHAVADVRDGQGNIREGC